MRGAASPLTVCLLVVCSAAGCGATKQRVATDQLLQSSAVDEAVALIDFRALSGQRVWFDTQYIRDSRSSRAEVGDSSSLYVISALRQQMIAAGCLLQDGREEADFIVEARIGALGSDGTEVVYGIPASGAVNAAAAAASVATATPRLPTIPEIAIAKKDNRFSAAKVVAYAYHRESRQPVWQSGIVQAKTTAEDRWLLGAGPFQKGTIYDGVQFAGGELPTAGLFDSDSTPKITPVCATMPHVFNEPTDLTVPEEPTPDEPDSGNEIRLAGHSIESSPGKVPVSNESASNETGANAPAAK